MVAQMGVLFLVGFHYFSPGAFNGTTHFSTVPQVKTDKFSVNCKKVTLKFYGKAILRSEETFTEGEVMDGIQKVGFAATVFTDYSVYFSLKRNSASE
jgi:hypothetical protein